MNSVRRLKWLPLVALLLIPGCRWLKAGAQQPPPIGCPVFPPDHILNVPIDKLPVDPKSATYIQSIGATRFLHPDFSQYGGGIPYNVVPASQPGVPIRIDNDETDQAPYPIPSNPVLEGGSDGHLLIVKQGECKLYEVFAAKKSGGGWTGGSGAIFDLRGYELRPSGWTSADAAGLPILAGLVRWDEVNAGEIKHAIRFSAPKTRREFVWPARHFASASKDANLPPMGQRFRLRANFDISGFPPEVQIMLKAMKKYGLVLADNGSPWFFTGTPDPRWNDGVVVPAFKRVFGSDFEAVDVSSLMISPNSAQARVNGSSPAPAQVAAESPSAPATASAPPTAPASGSGSIIQKFTLSSDMTGPVLSNLSEGQQVTFFICQDARGGHKFTWPANIRGGMRAGVAANKCSVQQFINQGGNLFALTAGILDQ